MTLNEFKAWLEGFEAAMGGNPPSAEQWAAIKAKLAKVEAVKPIAFREDRPRTWLGSVSQFADGAIDPRR
ncbi:hypothetical protein GOB40_13730 [Sinorhizobium meliloti]|nr:hypothetical protein [Sinorhizobium meliloti]